MSFGLSLLMAPWAFLSLTTLLGCRWKFYRKMYRTWFKSMYRRVELIYGIAAGVFGVITLNINGIQSQFGLSDLFPLIVVFVFACVSGATMIICGQLQRRDNKWVKREFSDLGAW